MTSQQKQQCPEVYRRLLLATLTGGESAYFRGEEIRRKYQPVGVKR
jgi:hypothetical protein